MNGCHIIDTGPLVASLNHKDRHHNWAIAQLGLIRPPLYTCEAVLTESCFLLRKYPEGAKAILSLVTRGLVAVAFQLTDHAEPIARMMAKYAEVPMSLADACLVRMTELHTGCKLLTLDNDFSIYRRNGRHTIPTLIPGDI